MKHQKDSDNMHPDDRFVMFKLYDFKHPLVGRYREFVDKGRWTESPYVYVHRADGLILAKYSYGFTIIEELTTPTSK